MKFMGYELEDLKGSEVILRGGVRLRVESIKQVSSSTCPIAISFTTSTPHFEKGNFYTFSPKGYLFSNQQHRLDIVSIEIPKKEDPEYEVFEINNYVDLDVLVSIFDSYGKVEMEDGRRVALYNGTLDTGYEYNITKGDKVYLYPKKLSKLERIEEVVDTFDSKDLEKAMSKIIDILGEE